MRNFLRPFKFAFLVGLLIFTISVSVFSEDSKHTIIVTGSAETEVPSNEWTIYLGINIKEKNKSDLTSKYNKTKDEVYAKLKELKIDEDELKTLSFSSSIWQEWEKNSYVNKGVRIDHTIKITLDNLEVIGKLVSLFVAINNLEISYLEHKLKPNTRSEELNKLYDKAFKNAETKIKAILKAADKELASLETISENDSGGSAGGEMSIHHKGMALMYTSAGRNGGALPEADITLVPRPIKLFTQLKVTAKFKN